MLSNCNLYCDASSKHGVTAWAFILDLGSHEIEGKGYAEKKSINKAELEAVFQGLKRVPEGCGVTVFTDSLYVVVKARKDHFQFKVSKIKTHPSHTRAHHLARELVIK